MDYENIIFNVEDRIVRITLNRPEKRNALSPGLRSDITTALKQAEQDDSVSVVLIDGAGLALSRSGYRFAGSKPGGFNIHP